MADDLGNADLGYRGGEIKTPNIDRLATTGVRCESFYGMPVCTPSRAALMTGRYPMRHGLQTLVIFPSHAYGLPTDERTLPQALKEAGYQTYMVGKWHLGHADQKYWPQNRGFDHFYGNLVGEVDYFTKERGGLIDWQRNGKFLKEDGYFTTLIGNEAVKLIEAQDPSKPFFLYFASLAPHAPYQVPKEYSDRYASIQDEKRRTYAGMITALDDQVGRIVAALEKKGLRDNTIIVFASDNGGATNALFATGARSEEDRKESGGVGLGEKPPASNGRFRAGKGSLYEGGVRVPAFVNWPGKLKPAVVNEPLHMVDVMPTLLALAGGKGSADHPFDGKDIWPTLCRGQALAPRRDPDQRRGVPRRDPQGRLEARQTGHLPGQDRALQPRRRPGGEKQRRRSAPRHRERAERAAGRLRPRDEAERVDQGAAGVPRGAEQDALRPRLRHRRRRLAAREAASAEPMIPPTSNSTGSSTA